MRRGTALSLFMFMALVLISVVQASIILDSHEQMRIGATIKRTSNSTLTINTKQYDRTCFGCVF